MNWLDEYEATSGSKSFTVLQNIKRNVSQNAAHQTHQHFLVNTKNDGRLSEMKGQWEIGSNQN